MAATEELTQSPRLAPKSRGRLPIRPRRASTRIPAPARIELTGARLVGVMVGLGALYALGALLPFWFLDSPESGALFFPAAGLTLAALAFTQPRVWPFLLVAIAVAEIAVDMTHGLKFSLAVGFALANTIEPAVGALGLRWSSRRRMTQSESLIKYVCSAMVLGPIVGGIIGATTAAVFGSGAVGWFEIAWHWALGDAIGVLVVATPIFAWMYPRLFDARLGLLGNLAIAIVAIGVTVLPPLLWDRPLLYAVLPVLMFAALRGGTRTVTLAGLGVAFAANWVAVHGRAHDLMGTADATAALVWVQVFLAVTLLAALAFAVEVGERLRGEQVLRETEASRVQAEFAAIAAAEGERRRIARETHDVVGHALNVMLLQTGAARRVLDTDPEKARDLLESIESTGRSAFGDLDVALGLVDRSPDLDPGRGLAMVPELIEVMRRAGVTVGLRIEGEPRELSTLVDWSAYRIIQEALTNVVKHAAGARADVTIAFTPDEVRLSVIDTGSGVTRNGTNGRNGSPRNGRGFVGMRERVAVLGGDVVTGPEPGAGFAVRVRLPDRGRR